VVIKEDMSIFTPHLQDAVEDAYKRLLFPSLERELRNDLTERADNHAIETFATNLSNLLLQPPLNHKVGMGIDPAFQSGCKVAVVEETGKNRKGNTTYPTPQQKKVAEPEEIYNQLIDKYNEKLMEIGTATASRETEQIIANFIQK